MQNELREQRLDEIVGSYLDGLRVGRQPDRRQLLEAHPDLAEELSAFFKDDDRMNGLTAPLRRAVVGDGAVAGRTIGEHEILEEIARGGMGIVYKARHKALNRLVAVKVLRAGPLATTAERQRFRSEAEAAAHLDHPNLVPVYEVGEQDGLLYFAMKLVEGGSLAEHMERFHGDPSAAADLIATTAEAVHYAHQRGFLHRDLKPANILLGPNGEPFVSDFGLAKRFAGENMSNRDLTHTGAVVGTPSYMAPEQASGQKGAVSTATDVYGLGAILYELLTGKPPFREATPVETLRQVVEADPLRPSARKAGINRDLETICLKCLEKDPARRYGGARDLAEDLQRFRSGHPIQVRPVGTGEFLWRWCRRRPAVAGLLILFALTVAVGFGLVVWQWRQVEDQARIARHNAEEADRERDRTRAEKDRAEANFRQTRELVNLLCNRFCEGELLHVAGLQVVRKQMLQESLKHYKQLAGQHPDDPEIRREFADTYSHLALGYSAAGEELQALASYREALAIYQQLHREKPADQIVWPKLAITHSNIAAVQSALGRAQAAFASCQEAVRLYDQFLAQAPRDPDLLGGLATTLTNQGRLYKDVGRLAESLAALERARALQQDLVRRDPKEARYQVALAGTQNSIGNVQADLAGSDQTALASYRAAQEIRQKLATRYPKVGRYQRDLAESYHNVGVALRRTGHSEQAIDAFAQERAILDKLVGENRTVARYRQDLARAHTSIGVVHANGGKKAEALGSFQRAAALQERLMRDHPGIPNYQSDLARSYFNIGVSQASLGQKAEAILAYQQSRDLLQKLVRGQPDDLDRQSELGGTLNNLGILQGQRGRLDEGLETLRQAVSHQRVAFNRAPQIAKYRRALGLHYASLGEVYRAAGRLPEAVKSIQEWQKLWPNNGTELYRVAKQLDDHFSNACAAALGLDKSGGLRQAGNSPPTSWQGCHDAKPICSGYCLGPRSARTVASADPRPLHPTSLGLPLSADSAAGSPESAFQFAGCQRV